MSMDVPSMNIVDNLDVISLDIKDNLDISPTPVMLNSMAYEDLDIMGYEPDWLNTLWQFRIPLKIESGQVPSTQTDFPLLINNTYTVLIGEVE